MLSWFAPILVFGLVILVHEAGHFIAAKLVGVYAPRFSIGFGKPIWRRRRGETEYAIGWLPVGGYVRMASREDEATAFLEGGSEMSAMSTTGEQAGSGPTPESRPRDWDPEAMMPFGPRPVPPDRWFESKPLWARLIIMVAGVTMNVLLALGVSIGIFAGYGRPYVTAVVDSIVAGKPAERAGMQKGDSIVAIDGSPIKRWTDATTKINSSLGTPLTIDVIRHGSRVALHMTPEASPDTNPVSGQVSSVGKIGAGSRMHVERERLSIAASTVAGWNTTVAMGASVIDVVRGLLTGKVSVTQLGGPIQIARSSVEAAQYGFESLLLLIAFLSVNVAILNLLPIPILDGGQILLNVAEAVKGSAFSSRTREYIMRAGLLAIALLFVIVMFSDITHLFKPPH